MIEISESAMAAISPSKESSLVRKALEDWKCLHELKSSKAFQWFCNLMENERRFLEIKLLNPRIVSDDEMAHERIRILEWRKMSSILERKEKEIRGILEKNQRKEILL